MTSAFLICDGLYYFTAEKGRVGPSEGFLVTLGLWGDFGDFTGCRFDFLIGDLFFVFFGDFRRLFAFGFSGPWS